MNISVTSDATDAAYVATVTTELGPTTRGVTTRADAIATRDTSDTAVAIQQFMQSTVAPPENRDEVINEVLTMEVRTGTTTRPISSDARVSVTGHDVELTGDSVPEPTADEQGSHIQEKSTT